MYNQKSSVSRNEIRLARAAPLYEFLVERHMDLFRRCGSSLYMVENDGIYIKQGFPGFNDFSSDQQGNPIDFLIQYLGYSFVDAVRSLNEHCHAYSVDGGTAGITNEDGPAKATGHSEAIRLPTAAQKPYKNMYAYLMKRGIPAQVIRTLEAQNLVYQEKGTNNIVFLNKEKDYCELRGTFTYTEHPYHGCRKSGPDRFWYMSGSVGKPQKAYVCEAAIDAISLYIIHGKTRKAEHSLYVSIGGVANQKAILRVKGILPVVLAVDNDRAGNDCRARNSDLPSIVPVYKDWNEDLLNLNLITRNVETSL